MSTAPRVLVADTPESAEAFRDLLTSSFDLVRATTFEAARDALDPPPALVVCGCHFDEGRMYDVLRLIKATPGLGSLPFLAVRCLEGELDDPLYESVKIAVRALGGNAFVDVPRWQRRWGHAEAAHRLTQLVQTLASAAPADSG
jgi:hypothetical protein